MASNFKPFTTIIGQCCPIGLSMFSGAIGYCDHIHQYFHRSAQSINFVTIFSLLLLMTQTPLVDSSGFFELQFLDGVHNSTTIHVCLKEFWNSQINFNRCTFGQKTIIYNEHHHPRQSAVKIPFSFRWIVST